MKKKICWRWVYKAINKRDSYEIMEGEWITSFSPVRICKWFDFIGFDIVYLGRMEYSTEYVEQDIPPGLEKESICSLQIA